MIKKIWQREIMRTEGKFNIPLPIKAHPMAAGSFVGAFGHSSKELPKPSSACNTLICSVLIGLLVTVFTHSQEYTIELLDILVASLVERLTY
jgi:hypothetical protein